MGVVEKGNKIFVSASEIDKNKVTVEWQQNFKQRSQEYYTVPFINKSQDQESVLFIQTNYLDAFKKKQAAGETEFTVVVDTSFQYGQNDEKTSRWIVYHDKSMNAFQWRFVASVKSKLGNQLGSFGGGIFKSFVGVDIGNLAALIGHPLRDF
ncbi:hypothetical protein BDP55DRAFT_373145 [Colletotrichum godetiae]|uniref:Uncharacterized protein n=1 Tax=Colletotrichum godetiae TaxID=1209918 RepID=A0AAJ0A969_9PEZI|nr:uncharacterized protein BDP55DRAFT_373145 [Colletotrichum godetiae]KAK1658843.1 hypothetical protein BDP55DRAFT_373145 [Colletotrichum godetiae]